MSIKGIIFDMDGVVTQTATVHFKAWKTAIMAFLEKLNENDIVFTEQDYFHYLDGMPRQEGLAHYLHSKSQLFPKIKTLYQNLERCIEVIGTEKNTLFCELIATESVRPFPDTLEFIDFLLTNNYQIALITSSKNCAAILGSAGIEHIFPIIVDGLTTESLNIPGKPNPGIFLEAAKRMGLKPQECLVVEDALAGVAAAKAGNFGGVIALDRHQKLRADFSDLNPDYLLPDLSRKQFPLYEFLKAPPKPQTGFQALNLINELLEKQYHLLIFSDFDGTLTPIVNTPSQAILSSSMRGCLNELNSNFPVIIVSGRALHDLKERIHLATLSYAGNHGLEFKSMIPELSSYCFGEEYKKIMSQVEDDLQRLLNEVPGCIIENKQLTLSIHYRLVDSSFHPFIKEAVGNILNKYPQLDDFCGKKVFELRPRIKWNKGYAAHFIFNHFRQTYPHTVPIYLGDDTSDEDAFAAFNCNGITIKVTAELSTTAAHYFLESPGEVERFLNQINQYSLLR